MARGHRPGLGLALWKTGLDSDQSLGQLVPRPTALYTTELAGNLPLGCPLGWKIRAKEAHLRPHYPGAGATRKAKSTVIKRERDCLIFSGVLYDVDVHH